jgi:hypothetical protein
MKNRSKSDPMRQPTALPRSVLAGRSAQCSWADGQRGEAEANDQSGIWLPSAFVGMTTRWRLLGGNFNALGGFICSIRSLG